MTHESVTFDLALYLGWISPIAIGRVGCLWVIASTVRGLSELISPKPLEYLQHCHMLCVCEVGDMLWHEHSSHTITVPDKPRDKIRHSSWWHLLGNLRMTGYNGGRGSETGLEYNLLMTLTYKRLMVQQNLKVLSSSFCTFRYITLLFWFLSLGNLLHTLYFQEFDL